MKLHQTILITDIYQTLYSENFRSKFKLNLTLISLIHLRGKCKWFPSCDRVRTILQALQTFLLDNNGIVKREDL